MSFSCKIMFKVSEARIKNLRSLKVAVCLQTSSQNFDECKKVFNDLLQISRLKPQGAEKLLSLPIGLSCSA